ncbi:cytochrome P450, family 704, subfamily B, polypeptide 1 isoform X2 [Wolffia australiana]
MKMGDSDPASYGIGATVAIGFVLWVVFHRWSQRNSKGPKTWPLIGAAIEQMMNYETMHDWLVGYLTQLRTVTVPMPFTTFTYTADPANVEHILKTNFSNYPKGKAYYSYMEVLLGDGIFNADGEVWRTQRKTASFEFASKNLRDFSTKVFREYAVKLSEILYLASQDKQNIDMQELLMRMTLDSIGKVGFGVEIGTLSPDLPENKFASAFDAANIIVTLRFIDPFWKVKRLLRVGSEALLSRSIKIVDSFTYDVIRKRKAEIQRAYEKLGDKDKGREDILSRFIKLEKLYAELVEFEKDAEKKKNSSPCEQSNEETFQARVLRFAGLLDYDSLMKLSYLHACITETLRLYPAVPQDPKGILENDVLPDGTLLKAGGMVTYVPYSMGRMEYIWGEDAPKFKPERWLNDGVFQAASPFKFTAFQAGPRICLGKDSAYLQMKMALAILCRFYTFSLVPGHPVRYRMMTILSMADGLKITVSRR